MRLGGLCVAGAVLVAADVNDWPYHDHDAGGQRFSPLKQITPANVGKLQRAWTFDTGVTGLQVTPLVINGIMYVTAGKDIIALEPETAKVIWRYTAPAAVSRRGVAYWPGDRDTPPRLFSGAGDRLLAVDAERGKPAAGFGDGDTGSVDLKASIRGDVDGGFSLTSPPTIYKNIVITGGNNGEQSPSSGLYGDIRGWDARTGKLLWSFHTVPRAGEPGVETWEGDSWKNRSGTNVWSFFTIDTERGIVYAPIGAPTSDYYGGDRNGANLYGNSVVALDATTGKLKWHQQLVHHDIWDYDVPAAPTLDRRQAQRQDDARGRRDDQDGAGLHLRSRHRRADLRHRRAAGAAEQRARREDLADAAVSAEAGAARRATPSIRRRTSTPSRPSTPPTARSCGTTTRCTRRARTRRPTWTGTMLTFPSTLGGGNWNGFSYDPTLGLAFTSVMNIGQVAKMVQGTARGGGPTTWVRRSPWGGAVGRFWNPETKIPCSAGPFGELVARRRQHAARSRGRCRSASSSR